MTIAGAHTVIFSTDPEADRAFFRDVLRLPHVDVGDGWLIFGLPPSEVAVHPSDRNDLHLFYLICDGVWAFVAEMQGRGAPVMPYINGSQSKSRMNSLSWLQTG